MCVASAAPRTRATLGPLPPRVSSRNRCHSGVTFGKNLKLVGALRWGRGFPRAAHLPPPPGASHARTGPCFFFRSFGGCWGMGLTISPPRHPGITACSAAPRTRTRRPSACLLSRWSMKIGPTNRGVVLPSWWSFHPSFAQLESDYCSGGPPSTYRWVM